MLDLLAPFSDDLASSVIQEDDQEEDDEYQRGLGGGDVDDDRDAKESSTSVGEMLELARYYATHASSAVAASSSSPSPLNALRALSGVGTGGVSTRHRPWGVGTSTSYDYSNSDAASFVTGDLFPTTLSIVLPICFFVLCISLILPDHLRSQS